MEEAENLFRQGRAARRAARGRAGPGGVVDRRRRCSAFLDAYPQIDITLGVTDRAVNLIEEGVDCALRVGELPDSGLVARTMGKLPLINVASLAYLARHGVPRTPADLDAHACVHYASPSTGRVAPWEWLVGRSRAYARCRAASRSTMPRPISLQLPGGSGADPDPGL